MLNFMQDEQIKNDMDQTDKIMEGMEIAYKRLIEFKKYKKTPVVIFKDGKVVELDPHKIDTSKNVYKKSANSIQITRFF